MWTLEASVQLKDAIKSQVQRQIEFLGLKDSDFEETFSYFNAEYPKLMEKHKFHVDESPPSEDVNKKDVLWGNNII